MVALSLLAASTLHFEVLLTKFFANKLEHHFTFAIISIALLGFGGGGVFVHLRSKTFSPELEADPLRLWRFGLAYAVSLPLAVTLFIVTPLDPGFPGWAGAIALPVYFLLFAVPFFFSGVCVSALLVARGMRPTRVYFWDLLGAGVGAVLGPMLLPFVGGYGSVVVASLLALSAAIVMRAQESTGARRSAVIGLAAVLAGAVLVVVVPARVRAAIGFDMVSFKHAPLRAEFFGFGPVAQTYWNPIARIDVSPTGSSTIGGFRYGLPRAQWETPLLGRMILVDGSANTRQYVLDARPDRDGLLGGALWAAPYVLRPSSARTLVLGPGGGIDILVGKAFGATHIDAVELNPDMYLLLLGRPEDPEHDAYTRWMQSDESTTVQVYQAEARHFVRAHVDDEPYDIVLASGVDTLTAIQSSGNALTENYLYTRDAVEDYLRLLRPGGQLALTHWHLEPPQLALKMFVTYLDVLDRHGVEAPGRRICVISEGFWENAILKKDEDYTREEVDRLRELASASGFQMVYDPFLALDEPVERPGDADFRRLGRASRAERGAILAEMPYDLTPATDARPYFYWVRPKTSEAAAKSPGGWLFPMASVNWMFAVALVLSLLLVLMPAAVLVRRGERIGPAMRALPFFAATGFAFILAENGLFLLLSLFVGGPLYSLSVVLPSMLVGYAVGSLVSLRIASATRTGAIRLAMLYVVGFALLSLLSSQGLPRWIALDRDLRLLLSVAFVTPFGALLGLGTPWYMEILKVRSSVQRCVAWMWGVSAAANVMGSLLFVPICRELGVHFTFAFAGGLYVVALMWAALGQGRKPVLRPLGSST